jgi:hypothetical protein
MPAPAYIIESVCMVAGALVVGGLAAFAGLAARRLSVRPTMICFSYLSLTAVVWLGAAAGAATGFCAAALFHQGGR